MKNKNLSSPKVVWICSLFLALLPFSVKAEEIRSFFRYATVFTRSGNSGESARILSGHYTTAITAQSANGWPGVNGKEDVTALPTPRGRTGALISAYGRKPVEY